MRETLRQLVRKFGRRCDLVELRREERESADLSFSDRLESIQTERAAGFALRVVHRGVTAFASVTDPERIEDALARLVAAAETAPRGGATLAPAPALRRAVRTRPLEDPRAVPLAGKKRLLKGYVSRLKRASPAIVSAHASYHETFAKLLFLNSHGSEATWDHFELFAAVSATAHRHGVTQSDHETIGSAVDFGVVRALGREVPGVADLAVRLTAAPKAESGIKTVILDPSLAGVFVHEAFGHTAEADGIADSPEKRKIMKIGARFGSGKLTIFDSGLEPGSRGALPFDDEGTPCERTVLIENGILVSLLHSRLTAGRMGARPTGSARAVDFRHAPIVRMRCTCIAGGTDTFADMRRGLADGLYCLKSMGGTGGEMFTFSTGHAYRIRDGEIGELVRDVKLSGNLFTTLNHIDMVGDDFRVVESAGGCGKEGQFPLPVAYGSPHIRIRDVVVGGA